MSSAGSQTHSRHPRIIWGRCVASFRKAETLPQQRSRLIVRGRFPMMHRETMPEIQPDRATSSVRTARRLHALVAEDDPSTRELVRLVLDQEGFTVHAVTDGVEAIEHVRTGRYALIVLDLRMPRVDGVGVLSWVRDHRPETLRHVVVTSALPPGEIESLCEPDVCRILPKPFDIEELRRIARSCANEER
jgi:CheY-like chemotaxis protein